MSESSSEDENAARLKEAVWSFKPEDVKINAKENNGRQSHRADVSKHEHDGNELGTTPEFRSHVAKKLGTYLDGCISEVCSDTVEPAQSENREDEEGFRLFSSSTPGKWMEQSPPPPPKRRPVPSSSDSDSEMEMRFREAAVSLSDILGPVAQNLSEKTEEKSTKEETEDTVTKMKKKKKRKTSSEESQDKVNHQTEKQSNVEGNQEQTTAGERLKKKKKKKKKKKRKKLEEDIKKDE